MCMKGGQSGPIKSLFFAYNGNHIREDYLSTSSNETGNLVTGLDCIRPFTLLQRLSIFWIVRKVPGDTTNLLTIIATGMCYLEKLDLDVSAIQSQEPGGSKPSLDDPVIDASMIKSQIRCLRLRIRGPVQPLPDWTGTMTRTKQLSEWHSSYRDAGISILREIKKLETVFAGVETFDFETSSDFDRIVWSQFSTSPENIFLLPSVRTIKDSSFPRDGTYRPFAISPNSAVFVNKLVLTTRQYIPNFDYTRVVSKFCSDSLDSCSEQRCLPVELFLLTAAFCQIDIREIWFIPFD